MSGFAIFALKFSSLLDLDRFRSKEPRICNLKNFFGINTIPSDTSMGEILDEVNPQDLRPAFTDIFRLLQRSKALEAFSYIDGKYLIAIEERVIFHLRIFTAPVSWKSIIKSQKKRLITIKCLVQ